MCSKPAKVTKTGCFQPTDRLLTAPQFRQVFRKGKRHKSAYLTMVAIPNQLSHGRLGLAVSKKAIRLSVGRNRVKRQIRESFRHHRLLLEGYDVVVSVAPLVSRLSRKELRQTIDQEWAGAITLCVKSSS